MRIAHITDLHLRYALRGSSAIPDRLSRQMPEALAAAVALSNALAPDLLVVTGDLVDFPLEQMDDPATRQRGLRDYRLIAEMLDEADCPVLALPGNHDHPELMRQVFGPPTLDQLVGEGRIVAFPEDAEDEDHAPHRTGASWERMLAACSEENTGVSVFAQHYVVWPDENMGYPHTYVEADAMREVLGVASGTTLCLSGHFHQGVPLQQHRGVWYAAVPALCVAPHPLWLYELAESVVVTEHVACWEH